MTVNSTIMNSSYKLNVVNTPRRSSSAMEHYSDIENLRSASRASDAYLSPSSVSRSGTLKKRNSMRQTEGGGLRRKDSTRSVTRPAQNVGGTQLDRDTFNNVYLTPVPTTGSPTDRLVDRFSG